MDAIILKANPALRFASPKEKYKHTKSLCIFLLLSVFIGMLVIPVSAGILSFFQGLLKDMLTDILSGTLNNNALTVFSVPPWDPDSDFSAAWGVANNIHSNVVRPVGFSLVGLCFTIKIAKMSTEIDKLTYERFLAPFLQLLACIFLVNHSLDLMTTLIRIGTEMAVSIHNAALTMLGQDVSTITSTLQLAEDSKSIFSKLAEVWESAWMCFKLIIPHLAYRIVSLILKVISYGVLIEIVVRAAIFPLFGGDIMLHGFESHGFRFLKGFMAVCLQGAIIILIAAIQNALNYNAVSEILGTGAASINVLQDLKDGGQVMASIGQILVFDFSAVALMLKSSQITREVLGV